MLSAKRFHIFNNFEVECIECKKNHILSSENSFPFYVCIGCEKSRIFMCFPIMCGGPSAQPCVCQLFRYIKNRFSSAHFFLWNASALFIVVLKYCNTSRSQHTIQKWSKWLDLISNDSQHIRFPHHLNRRQIEKTSTFCCVSSPKSIFNIYAIRFLICLIIVQSCLIEI